MKKIAKLILISCLMILVLELGFRFNENLNSRVDYDRIKTKGNELSIMVLGDSVSAEYPTILQKKLNSEFKTKFSINNFAKAYARNIDLINSMYSGMDSKPNLVILMIGAEIDSYISDSKQDNIPSRSIINKLFVGRFLTRYLQDLYSKIDSFNSANSNFGNEVLVDKKIYLSLLKEDRSYLGFLTPSQLAKVENVLTDKKKLDEEELELLFYVKLALNNISGAREVINKFSSSFRNKQLFETLLNERSGDYKKAIEGYRQLLISNNNYCSDIARLQVLIRKTARALETINECISRDENNITNYNEKIKILVGLSLKKEAMQVALLAKKINLKQDNINWEIDLLLSNLYLDHKNINESFNFLMESVRKNPNNYFLLKVYFDAILYRGEGKKEYLDLLFSLQNETIQFDSISKFVQLYNLTNSPKNIKSLNINNEADPRKKFLKAILLGLQDDGDSAYLEIESTNTMILSLYEVNRFRNFLKSLKRLDTKLIVMQTPNQKIDSLKWVLGDDKDVIFLDTYSYFKELVIQKKHHAHELFYSDAKHLSDLGNQAVVELIVNSLKKVYQ